nr:hypothetical protein [Chromobacterium sp. ASV5]
MGELAVRARDWIGVRSSERFIVHRADGSDFLWPGQQSGTLIYAASGWASVAQNRQPLDNPARRWYEPAPPGKQKNHQRQKP